MCTTQKIEEIRELKKGDVIQNTGSGTSYVVVAVDGDRATVVRSLNISNPSEWVRVIVE